MLKTRSPRFLAAVQARTARISASASATRGQGKGVVKAARDYLTTLPLSEFALARRTLFLARLEYHTLALVKVLPAKARRWGLARKLLNIFLRDALYTTYLAERYGLKRSELFYEIPLDSITTRHLRREAGQH